MCMPNASVYDIQRGAKVVEERMQGPSGEIRTTMSVRSDVNAKEASHISWRGPELHDILLSNFKEQITSAGICYECSGHIGNQALDL